MKKYIPSLKIILMLTFFGFGCTSTGIQTNSNGQPNPNNNPTPVGDTTTVESFTQATVNLGAFNLGSDFPPDIQIPDIDGMRSTAFIVTFTPTAVLPIDLDSDPLALSSKFAVYDVSTVPEAVFPNNLFILSPTQAFLLGSTHVLYFNPTTGITIEARSLIDPIDLAQPLPYSMPGDCNFDGNPEDSVGPGPFAPSFPADLAVVGKRLFVTMSNSCFDASWESYYIQGILLVFDINDQAPFLTPATTPFIVLPGYNATGITALSDRLIVTSTGDTTLNNGIATPQTDSYLAEIDPDTLTINNVQNLGRVAANFQPLAVNEDETLGFIGSSAFSEVYEIDLNNLAILRGENDPITIFEEEDDYITDQEITFGGEILLVSSFNNSGVRGVDLSDPNREVIDYTLDFSFPENPGVTGAGPMELRPGQPTLDFTGPDLWVLTSSPGTLSSSLTY